MVALLCVNCRSLYSINIQFSFSNFKFIRLKKRMRTLLFSRTRGHRKMSKSENWPNAVSFVFICLFAHLLRSFFLIILRRAFTLSLLLFFVFKIFKINVGGQQQRFLCLCNYIFCQRTNKKKKFISFLEQRTAKQNKRSKRTLLWQACHECAKRLSRKFFVNFFPFFVDDVVLCSFFCL